MTSENNSDTAVLYKPIYALEKLDPRLGDKQLYPQNFESLRKFDQMDLT